MLQSTPTSLLLRLLSSHSFEPLKSTARRRLKQQHELWASRHLLKLLHHSRPKLTIGDPQRQQPDILVQTEQQALAIEVTTIYYDQEQAKQAWDVLKGDSRPTNDSELSQLHQTDQVLIYNAQQAIDRKASKTYHFDQQLWLLIVISRPFKSKQTALQLPSILNASQATIFQKIYILYQDPTKQDYQAIELAPSNQ